jgi:hypothetical protein
MMGEQQSQTNSPADKILAKIASYDSQIAKLNDVQQSLQQERGQVINDNSALFCPVDLGQEIMYNASTNEQRPQWGKVKVEAISCKLFPYTWHLKVRLLDIPSARDREGGELYINITIGASNWKPINEVNQDE